jgi:hypothetical protein
MIDLQLDLVKVVVLLRGGGAGFAVVEVVVLKVAILFLNKTAPLGFVLVARPPNA